MKGSNVLDQTTSASEARRSGTRLVGFGLAAIVLVLGAAAFVLFYNLPDANAFNAKVETIFVENDLTTQAEIKLLEILAQSGTRFQTFLCPTGPSFSFCWCSPQPC